MNHKELSIIINSNDAINCIPYERIEALLKEYPYFQIGQILLLKYLYNNKDVKFSSQLKKTAIHVYDRKKLNKTITTKFKESNFTSSKNDLLELNKSSYNIEKEILDFSKDSNISKNPLKNLPLLEFNFSTLKTKSNKEYEASIIDKFISNNPKISRTPNTQIPTPEKATKSLVDNDDYISETLAKIYAQQNNIEKAILTYKKLSLKYPEKNTFFAKKIKDLKKKINK